MGLMSRAARAAEGIVALAFGGLTPREVTEALREVDARAASAAPPTGGPVMGPVPFGWQVGRIGGSLTPAQVSAILAEADTGEVRRKIDLENEARQKDCTLQSILGTRESAVAALPFQIVAPPGANSRDQRAAAWIQEKLQGADDLPRLFAHLTGAVYHGHQVAETIWKDEAGDIVPARFEYPSARRFRFDERTQRLYWCDDGMPLPGVDIERLHPGRFIIHQPRVNGDIPCREGLGRVLIWAALFRNWTIRDWLSLAELAWKPWRTGQYEKDASKEDIANLEAILHAMSASGVATHPETTKLQVHFPPGGAKGSHAELAAFLGAEMSKATLGQTLSVEQGQRGSLSLGKVHNEVRKDIREADAVALAATLRRFLLVPMTRANFSPQVKVPILAFQTEGSLDLKAFAEAVETLMRAGLRIPAAHVYDASGIPAPLEGEEVLGEYDVDVSELQEAA